VTTVAGPPVERHVREREGREAERSVMDGTPARESLGGKG
jgi:hypothetical protein